MQKGDRFYFYTDGLENFFTSSEVMDNFKKYKTIEQQKNYILEVLSRKASLKDDTTWLAIEVI